MYASAFNLHTKSESSAQIFEMKEIGSIYTMVNPQTKGPSFAFLIDITDNGTMMLIVRAQEQVHCKTHVYIQTGMIYNTAKKNTNKKQTNNKTLR